MSEARLALTRIDLAELAMAVDDHSNWTEWWFDPASGEVTPAMDSSVTGIDEDLDTTSLVMIEPTHSGDAYHDMVRFAEAVADPRLQRTLLRALEGKGAFRRFRDAVHDTEDLGRRWRDFTELASERRALEWLRSYDLVDHDELDHAIDDRNREADAILAELAAERGPSFTTDEVPDHWDEIAAHLGAGTPVTLTRAGRSWARIEPDSEERR